MHDNWIAFFAGVAWLAVFTAGLFAFANWVQRRDRRRRDVDSLAGYDPEKMKTADQPERKGEACP